MNLIHFKGFPQLHNYSMSKIESTCVCISLVLSTIKFFFLIFGYLREYVKLNWHYLEMRLDWYFFLLCKDFLDGKLFLNRSDLFDASVLLRNILLRGQPYKQYHVGVHWLKSPIVNLIVWLSSSYQTGILEIDFAKDQSTCFHCPEGNN